MRVTERNTWGLLVFAAALFIIALLTQACGTDADVASANLSKAADQFEVDRRVVFYNGITGEYILVLEGRCSLGNYDNPERLSVTCKVGEGQFKKHFLGLSDNVTYFAEQIEPSPVGTYRYRVIFKPSVILPDFELSYKTWIWGDEDNG